MTKYRYKRRILFVQIVFLSKLLFIAARYTLIRTHWFQSMLSPIFMQVITNNNVMNSLLTKSMASVFANELINNKFIELFL